MSYSSQVKGLTSDPGARFLGEAMDDLKAQLDALKTRVDGCCDDSPTSFAPREDAKVAAAPGSVDAKVR